MMVKDKESRSHVSSLQHKVKKEPLKNMNGVKKLKTFDIDSSGGFVCDINSGICGPVNEQKEGKE